MCWLVSLVLFAFTCGVLVQYADVLCQKFCHRKLTESEKGKWVGLALAVTFLAVLLHMVFHQPKENHGFLTVFESGFFTNGSILISLGPFIICAGCLLIYYKPQENANRPKSPQKETKPLLWGALVTGVVGIFTVSVDISEWLRCRDAEQNGTGTVVEGRVCVLETQPWSGHHPGDLLLIDGKQFRIDSFTCSHVYTKSIAHGGVLKDGVWARIHYVPSKRHGSDKGAENVIDAVIYRVEMNPRK